MIAGRHTFSDIFGAGLLLMQHFSENIQERKLQEKIRIRSFNKMLKKCKRKLDY
ncbi:hypothetical protein PGB90_003575 [Kerria lacca]